MNAARLTLNKSKRFCRGLFILLATAAILGLNAASSMAEMTTIRVHRQVEVENDEVLFGQIASIEGNDAQLMQQLKEIIIGKAPSAGKTRQYEQRHIRKRLEQHRIDLTAVQLEMPQRVLISRSYVEIDQPKIKKIITDYIIQNISPDNGMVRIKAVHVPDRVILSKGRIAYKVAAPRSRQLMGNCSLAVDFSVNGHSQKRIWATAQVEVLGPVVVTRKPLGRYKPISEDDIVVQTMDLANLPSNVLSDPEAVIGKRTKRAIGAQTPLRADVIELPPLVKRGDLVMIIVEAQGLKITARGLVKKKGRLGERIPVVNVDSKKMLYARVIDSNTVKVDF